MLIICEDAEGWRILISEGEILDTPPLQICESTMIIKVEKDVREYFRELIKYGFAHHAIAVPGHVGKDLEMFAEQLNLKICRL